VRPRRGSLGAAASEVGERKDEDRDEWTDTWAMSVSG
jgi:hypothetical protein